MRDLAGRLGFRLPLGAWGLCGVSSMRFSAASRRRSVSSFESSSFGIKGTLLAIVDNHVADFALLSKLIAEPKTEDRTLAIVCASYAEKYLGEMIQHHLPGLNSKMRETMFDPEGLFGPYAARVSTAKALALISTDDFHNLKLIGSIRNRFAHNLSVTDFEHEMVSGRVDQLRYAMDVVGETKVERKVREAEFGRLKRDSKFTHTAANICLRLHNAILVLRQPQRQHGAKD